MPIGSITDGTFAGKPVKNFKFERIKLPYLKMPSSIRSMPTVSPKKSFALAEPFLYRDIIRVRYQSARAIPTSRRI